MSWQPNIFTYTDYRAYLADYYEAGRANTRYFTHRWFAMKAGKSAGYLNNVISGRARVAESSCTAIGDALRLSPDERAYLLDMVRLDRATDLDRQSIETRLKVLRAEHAARWLDASRHAYLSRWFYVAIREMVALESFRPDPEWIAARLVPPVPVEDVEDCLRVLPELGVVQVDAEGKWSLGTADLRFEQSDEQRRALISFHGEMLTKAASSIAMPDRDLRYLVTKTIAVRRDRMPELRERLDRVLAEFIDQPDSDTVVQCHFSAFALATDTGDDPEVS